MLESGKERILIIAPHADDEILGCGGLIEKAARLQNQVNVMIAAIGNTKHKHNHTTISASTRKQEAVSALRYLGCDDLVVLYNDKDSLLDTIPKKEIITKLEKEIESYNPTMVFIPLPSHHQDHQVLYEACISALRPSPNQSIKLIAMYEYPLTIWYPQKYWNTGALYLDISSTISKKLHALKLHSSQLRPPNHLISPESVEKWAALRGLEAGYSYAEKYYILKSLIL